MDSLLLPASRLSLADDAAAAADVDAERATALAHSVLFSDYLWRLQLWRWLDRGSKNTLRGVSRAMCAQVEGSIAAVASPESGFLLRSAHPRTRHHGAMPWPTRPDIAQR
ncbi:hypothetical protein FOA52_010926 [Chlamydomonas sp. UWO 241]|nr:hypothetical protein FOA52_010926 [Chlamydomonas sp. UWO 241]